MRTNHLITMRIATLIALLSLIMASHAAAETLTFTYDGLNRLTSATYPTGRILYGYDSAGNMTRVATQFKPSGFCEDWESGAIDDVLWQKVGSPKPYISSNGYQGGYAVDVNGDAYCDSAVYTKREFYVSGGIIAEFLLKGHTSSSQAMGIKAGFTADLHYGSVCNPTTQPPGYYTELAGVYLDSRTGNQQLLFFTNDGQSYTAQYPGDDWHLYRIEIAVDGIVSFYMDGNPVYQTSNHVDLTPYPFTRFQLKGRSISGEMLGDNICVGAAQNQDQDLDGLPNAVENSSCTRFDDADTDGDGLLDGIEDANLNGQQDENETDPCNPDSDGDGMPDGWEVDHSANPMVADAMLDFDNDGFSNLREFLSGSDPWNDGDRPGIIADFATDNVVDGSALSILMQEFGRTDCESGGMCSCDVNMDGVVDETDLFVFSEDYGRVQ